jgi:PadR family transcriptional regulator, regulatory protein PadR
LQSPGADAYQVSITEELEEQTGDVISLSAAHAALYILQEKGFVKSKTGGASMERGTTRLFQITAYGRQKLQELRDVRYRSGPKFHIPCGVLSANSQMGGEADRMFGSRTSRRRDQKATYMSFYLILMRNVVDAQPAQDGIEPAIDRVIRFTKTEAVAQFRVPSLHTIADIVIAKTTFLLQK